ncbi:MAG: phosphoglycerate mutase family protein [Planctomycetota bacterium]
MAGQRVAFLRHGKAMAESPSGFDADRPLADRGHRQAAWMGETLLADGFGEAVVISSPAERTWTTAGIVAGVLGSQAVREDRLFTHCGVEELFEAVVERVESPRLIVVGHNPTISLAASVFTAGVGPCAVSLRTGEAAVCSHSGSIEPGAGTLDGVLRLNAKD